MILNLLEFLKILGLFIILYIIYPSLCVGWIFKSRTFLERIMIYVLLSTFGYTYLGYLLFSLNIANSWSILLALVVLLVLCNLLRGKQYCRERIDYYVRFFVRLNRKQYSVKLLRMRLSNRIHSSIKKLAKNIIKHPFQVVFMILILLITLYSQFYPKLINDWYAMPDMYIHNGWVYEIMGGNVFPSNIYPEGMHINIALFSALFQVDTTIVIQYIGMVNYLFILLALFCLFKKAFSNCLVITVFYITFASGIIMASAMNRLANTLPQEYAWIGMLPFVYFIMEFFLNCKEYYKSDAVADKSLFKRFLLIFKEPNLSRDQMINLFLASVGFAITIMVHFYTTIITVVFIVAFVIVFYNIIFRPKVFMQLITTLLFSVIIAIIPFAVAMAAGEEWNGSINWAMNVISGEDQKEDADNQVNTDAPGFSSEDNNEHENIIEHIRDGVTWYLLKGFKNITFAKIFVALFIVSAIVLFICLMLGKQNSKRKLQFVFFIFVGLMCILLTTDVFGLPVLMYYDRTWSYLSVFIAVVAIIPIEGIMDILSRNSSVFRVKKMIPMILTCVFVYLAVNQHSLIGFGYGFQMQYNGTVNTIKRIEQEFEKKTWTVVGTTTDITYAQKSGYHYEMCDFIRNMEDYNESMSTVIPTENVFFFIEKEAFPLEIAYWYSNLPPKHIKISKELALRNNVHHNEKDSRFDYYYNNIENRAVLQSKLYYWVQAYKNYFPREMTIYYEDEEVLVYRFHQDIEAPSNFAIPYYYNEQGKGIR